MNTLFASIMILNVFFSIIPPSEINLTTDCKPHYLENYYLPAWVTNDVWYREMPQHTIGKAVWYAPHLMNSTALYRGMSLEGFKGGVATNSVGMMGKVVWLKREGLPWEGPFLVVDVGQRNHAYHQAINVKTIVEVDFPTAIEWGIVSYNKSAPKGYSINRWYEPNVQMWVGLEPPQETNAPPIVYSEWYEENVEFCDGQPNRRWTIKDWMILNYDDYREAIELERTQIPPKAPIVLTSYQQEMTAHLQQIADAYLLTLKISTRPTTSASHITYEDIEIATEEVIIAEKPKILATHILKSHETWTHLALIYYGHMTEPYWRLIYEANIDLVGDKYHCIWEGMEIKIPALPPNFNP